MNRAFFTAPFPQHQPLAPQTSLRLPALLLIGLLLLLASGIANAQPRAWLDRNDISLGDTVILNIQSDSNSAEPDLTPLESDFRIVQRSSSSQISYVNGNLSQNKLWVVQLQALREGNLTLPALRLGNEQTQPLSLTVNPVSHSSATQGDDVFLEVETDTDSPYVQQHISYIVRLGYAVELDGGELDEPAAEGIQAHRTGRDIEYRREIDGRRYNIVERRYILIPERSGSLTIPAVTFRGRLARGMRPGSFFAQGTPVSRASNSVTLNVRPAPAQATSPWLPARNIALRDDAGRLPRKANIGDALELTLTAEAHGLTAEQLPELSLPPIEGAEIYPDQETRENRQNDGRLIGKRSRKFAIVPLREGQLTLPERSLSWWNIETGKTQRTTLPAIVLQVQTTATANPPSPASPPSVASTPASADIASSHSALAKIHLWQSVSAVLAALWLFTLIAWRLSAHRAATPAPQPEKPKIPDAWQPAFNRAIANNDLPAARDALLRIHPDLNTLERLANHLTNPTQRDTIQALERSLYRGDTSPDLITHLKQAFTTPPSFSTPQPQNSNKKNQLPELYS